MKRLTDSIPGIGGALRVELDDFQVKEVPLYLPGGTGEHTYVEFEKTGIATRKAVERIAQALGVNPEGVGVAGLKDARAVTRQWISVGNVDLRKALSLELDGIRIISTSKHSNKLRMGHLSGNEFRIRIRAPVSGAKTTAESILKILSETGVPNRFGVQRFGKRADGDLLGSALVRGAWDEFLKVFLGTPLESDPPASRRSRELFESGDIGEAMRAFPLRQGDEKKALRSLHEGFDAQRAVRSIPKRARLFMISAFQSRMFNTVLERRLDSLDSVQAGDLAYKHDSGAVFLVEDPDAEAPRAERFEISPSGPMFGYKTIMPEGRQKEIEQEVLDANGVSLESFKTPGGLKSKGERRPLRVKLTSPGVEQEGEDLWLSFALPPGSYATTVLDEVMKRDELG